MSSSEWAAFLRPFIAVVLLIVIVWPIKWLINKVMPDSKLKRFLFRRIQ